ncbi:MAG: hypothetical protein HJJLKODD_02930 [Phycisphaerae bacterium]|nr:hypothetical protein [Phycisphaerae bacterium]
MNTLTKTFVVLLVIFSITFTMMTIQFSASVPDWKDQAEKWRNLAQVTDTYNRNLIAAKTAESFKAAADRKAWGEREQQLNEKMATMQAELNDVKARLVKSDADATSMDATVKKLTAELGISQASAEAARAKRGDLEKRNLQLEKANLDLNEALNEKIATIIVMEQQVRQQEQSLALLKGERDKLLEQMKLRAAGLEDQTVTLPTDKVVAATAPRVAPIRGKIDQVNGEYASISVGTNDGVVNGMIFIIYNDKGYLGDLVISDVEPQSAAGKLKNVAGTIAIGDLVADESGYLAMN